ncbi:HPF/RaiA family ribosome-associated protein [Membranihabitans maritimus]|uniref:HPF/RaiA family ribosome-associated protein n=1 Tax=Membranihabitans maritimus TaxID=2904244 RepID=UPI001F167EFD|nr:HPF/RaiA family ribosome-associated protein [Membranihabitans maritimus]
MTVNIQFIKSETNTYLEEMVTKHLDKLSQKYEWIIRAEVFFKKEKGTYGKGKICEIQLSIPGKDIFASSDETSFEAAIAETVQDLERQLKVRKQVMYNR